MTAIQNASTKATAKASTELMHLGSFLRPGRGPAANLDNVAIPFRDTHSPLSELGRSEHDGPAEHMAERFPDRTYADVPGLCSVGTPVEDLDDEEFAEKLAAAHSELAARAAGSKPASTTCCSNCS